MGDSLGIGQIQFLFSWNFQSRLEGNIEIQQVTMFDKIKREHI